MLSIARDVPFQLRQPIVLVGPRASGDFAGEVSVLVPEKAVNEYHFAPARKHQVGLARKVFAIKPVAVTHGMGNPAQGHLGLHSLRVRPETLCRITEFSEHESNGRELDEGERVAVEVLPVLGQSAAAVEPGDGAFDHPTPGLDDEALHPIGSLDDLGLEIGQDAGQGAVKDRPLIGAVGEQFPEKGKQTEQGRQQRETAVAILNVGGGDDAVQQQALRIDQNMPLLALDQLAGIEAVAVDASPPFSALFTL